jgi:hypothetical protein
MTAATLLLSSTAAWSQETGAINPAQDFAGVDTDRDGLVSWAEFQLAFPEYQESEFNSADLDGDGKLSPEEFDNIVLATGSVAAPTPPFRTESLSSMSGDDNS